MIAALLPFLAPVIDRLVGMIPNEGEREMARAQALSQAAEALARADLAQVEVNKIEAASPSLFTSGWRPAAGWVCIAAILYNFMLMPIANGVLAIGFGKPGAFPSVDIESLWILLTGMLGLAGARSFEKSKGVASK